MTCSGHTTKNNPAPTATKKRGKTVQFDGTTEEANRTTDSHAPIPRKTKGKIQAKKPKIDKNTAVPEEKERTYGIDRLNLGDPAVKLGNESE